MKKILGNILILGMCCFCGCSFSKNEESDNIVKNDSEEVSYMSFDELSNVDKEVAKWETMCETVVYDIKTLERIVSVELSPCDYDEYLANKKIIITCKTDGSEEDAQKIIDDYVKALNFFEKYEIVID